MNVEELCQL